MQKRFCPWTLISWALKSSARFSEADFASHRNPDDGEMNRLYVVENGYTLTGGMADHRLPVRTSEIAYVTAMLARAVSKVTGSALPGELAALVKGKVAGAEDWVARVAEDLAASNGKSAGGLRCTPTCGRAGNDDRDQFGSRSFRRND